MYAVNLQREDCVKNLIEFGVDERLTDQVMTGYIHYFHSNQNGCTAYDLSSENLRIHLNPLYSSATSLRQLIVEGEAEKLKRLLQINQRDLNTQDYVGLL